jgi:Domain of unknown function (DUF4345)
VRDVAVYAVAAVFAGMGAYALAAPAAVLAIFGVEVASADGRSEVRAVYGGFGVAVAALLVAAAADAGSAREGILVAVGFALAGMAAGRIVARAVERPSGFYPVGLWFLAEVVMAALLLAAAWA